MLSRVLLTAVEISNGKSTKLQIIQHLNINKKNYHNFLHRFSGYKYTGYYTNLKIVDPNLERYSPLLLIPRKNFNRFTKLDYMKDSVPLMAITVTIFSLILTTLCFTEKQTWKLYEIANRIFYYFFKPFMEIMAFTLNLNVDGPKIEVPDKMAYHRDSDCKVITNLDFFKQKSTNDIMDGNEIDVEPIEPLSD